MLHHPTVDKLHALHLSGMAAALAEQQSQDGIDRLGFEERLGLLVERESSVSDRSGTPNGESFSIDGRSRRHRSDRCRLIMSANGRLDWVPSRGSVLGRGVRPSLLEPAVWRS